MAEVRYWQITGRSAAQPVPEGWREQLVALLGQRPRRLGLFTELALYGALQALAASGERALPAQSLLRISSLRGPVTAISEVLEQACLDLPMPFSFLQSQPSQMLAALASGLQWQGDASFMPARDPLAFITLAARQAGPCGLLLGWVEEAPATSHWLRLVPVGAPAVPFAPLSAPAQLHDPRSAWLALHPQGLAVA